MDTSDDAVISPKGMPDIEKNPAREVFTDPALLDPQKKSKKKKLSSIVNTSDWDEPVLGNPGILGFGDE